MRILGVIPARGGSKGIPGKNTKLFHGTPLIARAISDAKRSSLLSRTIVTTDSPEIAACAQRYGGDVPFLRPAELATDSSPSIDAVLHALESLAAGGDEYDLVCLIQPTYPLRANGLIDAVLKRALDLGVDSVFTALEVPHQFNPHWVFEERADGMLSIATGETQLITRRQDLPRALYRDGAVYVSRVEAVRRSRSLVGGRCAAYQNDPGRYVNLDAPDDWVRGEQLARLLDPNA